jgi:hypothetical protein
MNPRPKRQFSHSSLELGRAIFGNLPAAGESCGLSRDYEAQAPDELHRKSTIVAVIVRASKRTRSRRLTCCLRDELISCVVQFSAR